MLKIGIYLGYAPEQPITNQGIGRLAAFIIKGILDNENNHITLACPKWYLGNLHNLLNDFEINPEKVTILTTPHIPFALRIRNWHLKESSKKSIFILAREKIVFAKTAIKKFFTKQTVSIASSSSLGKIILKSFLWFFLILSMAIFFIPLYAGLKLFAMIYRFCKNRILRHPFISKCLNAPISILKFNATATAIYQEIRKREFLRLNKIVNSQKDIHAWYIPSLFWPEITGIAAKKIIAAPDAVYLEFPVQFGIPFFVNVDKQMRLTAQTADTLICYSEHVKQNHFIEGFNLSNTDIRVIHHGWIDLSPHLKVNNTLNKKRTIHLLQEWFKKTPPREPWFTNFNIGHLSYFFYSSQERPHKNLLNLIKAFEHALRKKFVNAKLILTARIHDPDTLAYIQKQRLQFEIIQLYEVPTTILAALNALAVCAINPSYFEGGFPFTFSEAYSVGTPSIMSDIPVVRETIKDDELAQSMLFDPTDPYDMADKMAWAFHNRQNLLEIQKPLAENLRNRTWEKVASEYIDVMKEVSQHD